MNTVELNVPDNYKKRGNVAIQTDIPFVSQNQVEYWCYVNDLDIRITIKKDSEEGKVIEENIRLYGTTEKADSIIRTSLDYLFLKIVKDKISVQRFKETLDYRFYKGSQFGRQELQGQLSNLLTN